MWVNTYVPGDVMLNLIGIVVSNMKAFNTRLLPSLHSTVIRFALDWESHKSLKHDHECVTELLECAFWQPYPIQ